MSRTFFAFCLFIFVASWGSCLHAKREAKMFRNHIYANDIHSLTVQSDANLMGEPVISIGGGNHIVIGFDEMSHRPHFYSYRIRHCESDWTLSEALSEQDFFSGIRNLNDVDEAYQSSNTTFLYTHYSVEIPNEDVSLSLSGNYVAEFVDTENPDSVVATACFCVQDGLDNVSGEVSSSTSYGVNDKYQQLNFKLDCSRLNVSSPSEQLKIVVRQNGRTDNEVVVSVPTVVEGPVLNYYNQNALVFEGGSEFSRIDFSHIRNYSGQIDRISYNPPYYHVDVIPYIERYSGSYQFDNDVNGRFRIHAQDVWSEKEIDYSIVHFFFKKDEPYLDGNLYVAGYLNDNYLDKRNKMTYNFESHQYECVMILKNGGYNYQFLFLPNGQSRATSSRTSGSYWQTGNEYQIFVYYRPIGEQFDRLVSFCVITSQKNN